MRYVAKKKVPASVNSQDNFPVPISNIFQSNQPIRSGWIFNSAVRNIFQANQNWLPTVSNIFQANQNWLDINLCHMENFPKSWKIFFRIYSCWDFFLNFWKILLTLYCEYFYPLNILISRRAMQYTLISYVGGTAK